MRFLAMSVITGLLALSAPAQADFSPSAAVAVPSMDSAIALLGQYRYAEAATELRTVVANNPASADAHNLLGYASRKSGDYATAETAYATALSLDPNHLGALEYQGELFITLGRLNEAHANLALLTALCPAGCEERDDLAAALGVQ